MRTIARTGAVIVVVVFGILAVQAAVCADGRNKTAILVLLVDIRDNTSRSARQDSADKLEKLIRDMNPADRSTISPETIDAISALLSDSDDYVVYMAAAMLGHIGVPTALRSVPWLLKSLREIQFGAKRDQRFVDVGPIDTIVGALQSLKVCVPKPGENGRTACDYLLR